MAGVKTHSQELLWLWGFQGVPVIDSCKAKGHLHCGGHLLWYTLKCFQQDIMRLKWAYLDILLPRMISSFEVIMKNFHCSRCLFLVWIFIFVIYFYLTHFQGKLFTKLFPFGHRLTLFLAFLPPLLPSFLPFSLISMLFFLSLSSQFSFFSLSLPNCSCWPSSEYDLAEKYLSNAVKFSVLTLPNC